MTRRSGYRRPSRWRLVLFVIAMPRHTQQIIAGGLIATIVLTFLTALLLGNQLAKGLS